MANITKEDGYIELNSKEIDGIVKTQNNHELP